MGNVLGEHLGAAAVSCTWCAGGRPGHRMPDGPLVLPALVGSPQVAPGSPNFVVAQNMKRTASGKNFAGVVRGMRRKRTSTFATLSTASDGFQEHSGSEEETGTSEDDDETGGPDGAKKTYKDLEAQRISEASRRLYEDAAYVGVLSNKSCKLCLSEDGKVLKWVSSGKKNANVIGSLVVLTVSKVEAVASNDKALTIFCTEPSGAPASHTFLFKTQKIRQEWEAAFLSLLPKLK